MKSVKYWDGRNYDKDEYSQNQSRWFLSALEMEVFVEIVKSTSIKQYIKSVGRGYEVIQQGDNLILGYSDD